ncbi:lipopolysaccharide export system permease protein [Parabacteroides sp. PF5-5]|uniref:LptF/LptG family permease n=1 Tax=unclassified Parabacteroides TaxID=2649774 RepID=UPI0024770EA8|nr:MULTISPECIES: LptF/LptG family permease [unclassified Parabacteroides]MDH6305919.1 lipopolysaccharide export system permease protein [Parabacteroides sp. PH5-39]MDH6316866.1 lipopolysaccharide export system permease protein [Parabacteroides sp. PF5-13]MDH6320631.1 lipopolysaccharide export system permease protein [Parabacteroides sp. PH5-13]MDH6324448.1 lipopolysaccharide export system permease protein [Parabacteroides sp. PH5-8]MDH6328051.1 lipopolysaccharide export system permease protein
MLKIKRLYTFMMQTFLPLFFMTFGICLFIVLMQFIWRYIDDMVGKGLDMLVLGEMFLYAALSLVPMALPLAILLSSLMTFGNLGERLELLAMKSAGVSLIHIMKPLIILIFFVSVGAFFFQNNVMPVVQVKLYSLLYSMRQKSPELDIPEGVFFQEITGYNLYVRNKNTKTGLLGDLMIYDYSEGFNNARVFVADSGRLKTSDDKLFLVLTLYSGESFENVNPQANTAARAKEAVPYRRETFSEKEILIEFDGNFNRTDESFFQNNYIGKDLETLQTSIDSMTVRLDSIKNVNANNVYASSYKRSFPGYTQRGTPETPKQINDKTEDVLVLNYDSLYLAKTAADQASMLSRTKSSIENLKSDYHFKALSIGDESLRLRRHITQWHKTFAVSFACLVFFFIGAPLGAIIRKGGLGTPVVISVVLFIIYYVIDNMGFKMARDGVWPAWQGMWLSSAVLTPLGIFLTYKAVNDSVILNADTYLNALKSLIGRRATRKVERKEVIIFNPDYKALVPRLENLISNCRLYISKHKRWISYITYWREGGKDAIAEHLALEMESIVEELSNSDQNLVLNKLMDYPFIGGYKQLGAHLNPKLSLAIGVFFPLGLPVYFLSIYQRKLLRQDIETVRKVSEELKDMISEL